jgi:anti-sigma regulatory factor (Ser/Thr protein kinase)
MSADFAHPETAEIRLKPDLALISTTLSVMKEYFQTRGLRPDAWPELELAAAEALNNAVEHGSADRPEAEIVCRWSWTDEVVRIEITDTGNYRPPSDEARLPDDPLAEEGRGAFLMMELVDSVEHVTSPLGHSIRLTKRVGTAR